MCSGLPLSCEVQFTLSALEALDRKAHGSVKECHAHTDPKCNTASVTHLAHVDAASEAVRVLQCSKQQAQLRRVCGFLVPEDAKDLSPRADSTQRVLHKCTLLLKANI